LLTGLPGGGGFGRWGRLALSPLVVFFSRPAGRLLLGVLNFIRLLAIERWEPVLHIAKVAFLRPFIKVSFELALSTKVS
jgi:hypothetical protein